MRTTITFNDVLYKTLRKRAIDSGVTVSAIVEDAVKHQLLEDMYDIELAKQRQDEPTISYDQLVKTFTEEGLL